ncbi:MAG TPA: type II toxin-antitoxin system HicB family antitoxin [bacterium]|jgi:predicted HicB family RNase H-like nuclease
MKSAKPPLEYKGYTGTVEYSPEDKVFWGKLDGIRATVTYEGHDPESLESAFRESVEDYLDLCATKGISPEKPYKGTFNVRISPDLHRALVHYAQTEDTNLNSVAKQAFEHFLQSQHLHRSATRKRPPH